MELSNEKDLVEFMKYKLNEEELELFTGSFWMYLKYHPVNDFVVDLDLVIKWLSYSQKGKAKQLLKSKFQENVDYVVQNFALPSGKAKTPNDSSNLSIQNFATPIGVAKTQSDTRGGSNKETILLSINCFKKFCMKANTKKSDQIHDYYIKIEQLSFNFIQHQKEIQQERTIKQIKTQEKHDILLREFANSGPLIYIIKVKSLDNGRYIVKIGESRRGILGRFNQHSGKYEECVILDCFSVARSRDFELFLHNHSDINPSNYKCLENHTSENELFLIGNELSYSTILNIIHQHKKFYDDHDSLFLQIEHLKLENERLNLLKNSPNIEIYEELRNFMKETKDNYTKLTSKIQGIEKLIVRNSIKTTDNFDVPISRIGDKLQKINPETFELVEHYETVSECMKLDKRIKRPSLNKAISNNTVYCGHRWLLVDKTGDASVVIKEKIPPTTKTKIQCLGYVAKLNSDKTKILNVYIDRKTAARLNGYRSHSSLDNPVKFCKITNGNYYVLYNDCEETLKSEFNDSKPVILYKNGIGKFDKKNRLLEEFENKYCCIRDTEISEKSLNKALETENAYNGYFYKNLGSKLSIC